MGGILMWYSVLKIMRNYVSKIKAKYVTDETKIFENLNVYFKNFDISKKKNFFPSSNALMEPIYAFSKCDLFINHDSILLVGKMKSLLHVRDINITVFKKDKANILGTIFKAVQCTKTHIEIEFTDTRFEKSITAMVKLPKDSNMLELLMDWN